MVGPCIEYSRSGYTFNSCSRTRTWSAKNYVICSPAEITCHFPLNNRFRLLGGRFESSRVIAFCPPATRASVQPLLHWGRTGPVRGTPGVHEGELPAAPSEGRGKP
jgi:hypothetical protein